MMAGKNGLRLALSVLLSLSLTNAWSAAGNSGAVGMTATTPLLNSSSLPSSQVTPVAKSIDSAGAETRADAPLGLQEAGMKRQSSPENDAKKQSASEANLKKQDAPDSQSEKINPSVFQSEFQTFVAQSVGRNLPMYGFGLFQNAPTTFAPVDNVPVTPDYVVGPGDELIVHIWGQVEANASFVVDRNGLINLPQIGSISVAGVSYQKLSEHIGDAISRKYSNFEIDVSMGKLRSIQVLVVGQAARPGNYTVSSLSTLVNAVFASGGPSAKGSMRHIQLKRGNKVISDFDLYDLLLKGDKSKDVKLLPGDVIYIPPVGAMVAISGSVNTQAIFELKGNENLADVLDMAGGLTNVAAGQSVSVERIFERRMRKVDEFQLDMDGLNKVMHDGDVVTVFSISPKFENAVKLQGNVAAPMRYIWKDGMRITDILKDKNSVLPGAYWAKQNSGSINSNYNTKEVNWDYAVVQRLDKETLATKLIAFNLGLAIKGDPVENMLLEPGDVINVYSADAVLPKTGNDVVLKGSIFSPSDRRFVWRKGMHVNDLIPSANWLTDYYDYWVNFRGDKLNSGINWSYANVVRLNHADLTREMLTFNLGKAVRDRDAAQNLALLPGDEVTVFTNNEIHVSGENEIKYVKLEGEIKTPGIYPVRPGETLRQLVARVGGVTPQAYLFSSEFTRESTRKMQQKRLDEMVDRMESAVQRSAGQQASGALSPQDIDAAKAQAASQQALIAKMRQVKATGRIVLEMPSENAQVKDLPDIELEDGDRLYVSAPSSTVNVMGMVYNQNAFIYRPDQTIGDYIGKAGGPTRDGDEDDEYLVRADGTVLSKRQGGSMFSGFSGNATMPGDTIVVMEKLERFNFTKELKDWTQIVYQFALAAAGGKAARLW